VSPRASDGAKGEPRDATPAWRAMNDRPFSSFPAGHVSSAGRTFADEFGPDSEPDWLRRRRVARQAIPAEQWTLASATAESVEPDSAQRIALSASDVVLAALPLLVGLVLLWLGFGSGQVTLQA